MLNPTQIIEPEWLLPFEGMAIGESFFIPTLRPAELIYSIDCGSKRARVRVKSYVTHENGYLGVRCWRTA
jgi:hypothetical protein